MQKKKITAKASFVDKTASNLHGYTAALAGDGRVLTAYIDLVLALDYFSAVLLFLGAQKFSVC